ncbi:hypothetical protein ACFO5R_07970 [Halosolutus amylolyticus]|uniref:Uncharacterized protein n=1 Tax=Halosolutus amylolyticus TaxID=2932267 RepID=A0ABD5PMU2_9EURY|nr:hypothetical protein [Halosolutus amylolyticus]
MNRTVPEGHTDGKSLRELRHEDADDEADTLAVEEENPLADSDEKPFSS